MEKEKREITFRGKSGDEWFFGSLVQLTDETIIVKNGSYEVSLHTAIRVRPETVGQFTGLKDRANNEVYEGDIVQCFLNSEIVGEKDVVEFKDGGFDFRYRNMAISYWLSKNDAFDFEVIGNRFDNPELIK